MKLRKLANISTATERCEGAFTDTMHSLLSYAGAFVEDHGVRFIDASKMDNVEYIMCSEISWLLALENHIRDTL